MSKKSRILENRLRQIEVEFRRLLIPCLKECASGRWGLFGKFDLSEGRRRLHWPEAERLKDLAREIQSLRKESGESDDICERFLSLCSLRGPNVPGEPKIAAEFLSDLQHKSN